MQLAAEGPVLVVGPGAIGALVAARLAAAGTDAVVACRTAAAQGELRRRGVAAIGQDGARVEARPPVVHRPGELKGTARMLVLATKCAAAEAALRAWLPAAGADAPVIAMQNGVIGDRLAAIAGDRLVECTVALPATLEAPGVSRQTGPGHFVVGPWPKAHARDDPAAFKAVARVLADAAPVQASPNMRGVKWSKLLINSCITSLGVATGHDLGVILKDARAQAAFLRIVEEGYAAGVADDVRFEAVSGFRPRMFAAKVPGRRLLLAVVARRYRNQRSSSLQSLERGQKTEVDFLNGHIVATAKRHGLAAPVNQALVDLIHRIEDAKAQPSPGNLADLAA